jgi:hypothetical protein
MIENRGLLDVAALVLLGASTKREDDSKIGFFGSGNKYAIATLLRKNVGFKIFVGEKEINITTEEVSFREKKFQRIFIDGEPTSLTTDMGPQWVEWMAVREWVSNSMDEGGSNIVISTENVIGREGHTRFFVEHNETLKDMISKWNEYFSFDRDDVLYETREGKIFRQTNTDDSIVLYRKGIRAFDSKGYKTLYHYDMKDFGINESRLIDSLYTAGITIVRYLASITDLNIIRDILKNAYKHEYFEGTLQWKWGINRLGDSWKEAIGDACIVLGDIAGYYEDIIKNKKSYQVSLEMASQIRRSFPDIVIYGLSDEGGAIAFKPVEQSQKVQFLLKECLKFCDEVKIDIKYPIEVVEFEQNDLLGKAHNGKILLSQKVFELGKKEIVSTLLEENEHIKTGYLDKTRAFQNHFINLYLSEKEERYGFFL